MPRSRFWPYSLSLGCLLLGFVGLPAGAQEDYGYSSPPGPNEEPSSGDTLFEQSDLGNVAQAAQSHYHSGRRELQSAEKLARRAAEAPSEERRSELLERRSAALERAAEEFSEAIGFDKGLLDAYLGLGQAYAALSKHEEALQVHAAALEIEPESEASFQGWAAALLALNRLGDAVAAYETYAGARPERARQLLDGMKQWLEAKQRDPGEVAPEAIQRLADWLAQHSASG